MPIHKGGKLNILQLAHGYPPAQVAGTEVYTFNLANELKKNTPCLSSAVLTSRN